MKSTHPHPHNAEIDAFLLRTIASLSEKGVMATNRMLDMKVSDAGYLRALSTWWRRERVKYTCQRLRKRGLVTYSRKAGWRVKE